jgi:hypothetical protein
VWIGDSSSGPSDEDMMDVYTISAITKRIFTASFVLSLIEISCELEDDDEEGGSLLLTSFAGTGGRSNQSGSMSNIASKFSTGSIICSESK